MPANANHLLNVVPESASFTPSGGSAVALGDCREFLVTESATVFSNHSQGRDYGMDGGTLEITVQATLSHRDTTNHIATTYPAGTAGALSVVQKGKGGITTSCTYTLGNVRLTGRSESNDGGRKLYSLAFEVFSSNGTTAPWSAALA